jgi:hypothetical protein
MSIASPLTRTMSAHGAYQTDPVPNYLDVSILIWRDQCQELLLRQPPKDGHPLCYRLLKRIVREPRLVLTKFAEATIGFVV